MNASSDQTANVFELLQRAEAMKAGGDEAGAVSLYRAWIDGNEEHALLYAVYFNLSVILSNRGDLTGARDALLSAVGLKPDFLPAIINLGSLLERFGLPDQAVMQWASVVQRLDALNGAAITHKLTALNQMARVLERAHEDERAEGTLRQSLELDPSQTQVIQHLILLRQRQCKWPVLAPLERIGRSGLMRGMSPLSMSVYTDDPALQLASAWHYNKKEIGRPSAALAASRRQAAGRRSGPLRIGYVSTDLREHAIGYLTAELFELHDREKVEVFAYYCGIAAEDTIKARIRAAVDHWIDINGMDDQAVASRMSEDGIDILVDVNGYTGDARTKLFALRPAPIIVNWLGYPGTLGSPYHHYIIADDWIIPEAHEIYYSEKVVRLPCYQPNDSKRRVSPVPPTRADVGLPEEAMVYCCFNGMQKITRFSFERWMTILRRVPDSVLWILGSTEPAHERLRVAAQQSGVASDRLIFAGRLPNADHLARYPLADLFLDTSPYGAHTTASDAMWMGVPVLTLSGRGFASRVCGSTVRAAGLPELVCTRPEDYVERAVQLGSDRALTRRYSEQLRATRHSCTLFDTTLLARRLEALYAGMWQDLQEDRLPRPDLANLDVYFEVGIEEDHEAAEVQVIGDYEAWFRAKLARRHQFRPIGEDRRLWTARELRRAEEAL